VSSDVEILVSYDGTDEPVDNERFCRCGCGEKLTGRPEKVYYDRLHKDRVRNRKRREALVRLRDHFPAWEAVGKLMGWL